MKSIRSEQQPKHKYLIEIIRLLKNIKSMEKLRYIKKIKGIQKLIEENKEEQEISKHQEEVKLLELETQLLKVIFKVMIKYLYIQK
ncbi:hypothetical protein K502DRAFT_13745 [Neoconidiobolus thromboides FSU 785]|nr:hypothetical protein K502DRAFT_13745 [Neoconidiobolus thromboides FSU 785]